MIYLIFGEMGIGKNYVGEKLARHIGCPFFDGDTVIPKSMIEKVLMFKPLTAKDIDNYVTNYLIPGIEERYKERLVVAQALYRKEHREQIQAYFGKEKLKLVWIPARPILEHFGRLLSRENGWKWVQYGLSNKPFFQNPVTSDNVFEIVNEKDKDLSPQFEDLIKEEK